MASNRNDEHWIRNTLVPLLARQGKLSPDDRTTISNVQVSRLSLEECFMLTACYKIKVDLVSPNHRGPVSVQLVVKITPQVNQQLYDVYNFSQLFSNEVVAYERIFPKLGWSSSFPKYYYSHIRDSVSESDSEAAIVLGDFTVDGWRMSTARFNLSLDHILVSVSELGKLHGTMYGLKQTDRVAFTDIISQLQESRFRFEKTSLQWDRRLRSGPKRAANAVRNHPEYSRLIPEQFLSRLEEVLENTFLYQRQSVRPEEPLAILCHGDFLRNNIAFKYSNVETDTPSAAMMFDFQTLRYASPMVDMVAFIANSTGIDVRCPNFDRIFRTYHNSMREHFCKSTGAKPDELPEFLSYENFLREYAIYLPFGLSIAASFMPVLHVPDTREFHEYPEIPTEEDIRDAFERGGEQVDRELRGLVREMYELQSRLGVQL